MGPRYRYWVSDNTSNIEPPLWVREFARAMDAEIDALRKEDAPPTAITRDEILDVHDQLGGDIRVPAEWL